jgi:YYY domain-containing protein
VIAKRFKHKAAQWGKVLILIALLLTLAGGAYLRLVGVNWDENQHMHPDERFLSLVQTAISPVTTPEAYFDTESSSLNPANRGHTFFVYGTLPIFIIRYVGEALGKTDYHAITIVGRYLSAIFDLVTVLLVFAIGKKLYRWQVGILGAAFYALAVLPIQLSHYMTVDTITNTFAFLAIYGAVWALRRVPQAHNEKMSPQEAAPEDFDRDSEDMNSLEVNNSSDIIRTLKDIAPYVLFGIALGAATASKINAVVIAIILPLVEGMRFLQMDDEAQKKAILPIIRNLVLAAILSFIVFRIGQPYAFNGPGFFNMGIDENWWASIQSLRSQASGAVDFPPALQWARRPITFSWQNMVAWGLGLPLGLFASLSFLGMGLSILRKKQWFVHLPLWAFTGLYFAWQSFSWVRSMRYQMLIYPAVTIIAGWGLVRLWSARKALKLGTVHIKPKVIRTIGIILAVVVILSTAAWAFAFSRIYTRPHTRVAASRWIYQNIPGALTLQMVTEDGAFQQPLPYRAGDSFESGNPYRIPFIGVADGSLLRVNFPHIVDQSGSGSLKTVLLTVISAKEPGVVMGSARMESEFLASEGDWRGASFDFLLGQPITVAEGDLYYLQLDVLEGEGPFLLNGSLSLEIISLEGMSITSPLPRIQQGVRADTPYDMNVQIVQNGTITAVTVPHLVDQSGLEGSKALRLDLAILDEGGVSGFSSLESGFQPESDLRGESYTFVLDEPLEVKAGQTLRVTLSTEDEGVRLVPHAPAPVHESSWDDAIPYPVDGFSPYSESGGIYRGDLNFEMYWSDDQLKLKRFETNLDMADYIFITSNRQWGTTTRVPERYLLTTAYYQNLLGCPDGEDIEWCYSVAEPGMFEGSLGFELVETFTSNPNLGPIEINSQFAEEAFTVYDHPKVLIFQKTDSYDPIEMRQVLRSVDLSKVVYFTPGEAANYHGPNPESLYEPRYNLMLPENRLQDQRDGGTWSELFDREKLINRSQVLACISFYVLVTFLGLLSYPIIRMALPGLADRGYPLSKLAGLLVFAFVVWMLGSLGVSFSVTTILIVLVGMILVSGIFIVLQRGKLWAEIRQNWSYFLTIEILAVLAFIFFLLVRFANPDLWHPYKGGEKPMDFSYLNAVLKSTTFPPYDPWFAGGYINYYYYGFVILAVPIKLLGIVPAVAYNIVLPIWYSILILGAFSVGWNLYRGIPRSRALRAGEGQSNGFLPTAFWVGLATALVLGVLGNLGTVDLMIEGFQRIASGGAIIDEAGFGQRISWAFQGFFQFIKGTPMPFYPGDWYWFPSRVIPGDPITEFPYFTFIYGDLHAHLIAFPITIFVISWSLSVVLSKGRWGEKDGRFRISGKILGFFLGALVIGALRPTNTWDFYTYIVLASIALFYTIFKHHQPRLDFKFKHGDLVEKFMAAVGSVLVLVILAILFYQPFAYWYGQGYNQIEIWRGDRTPLKSYLTHWGLFLFIIVSWMAWETYHWMKTTPQSALKRLDPYKSWIYAGLISFVILSFSLLVMGVSVALIVIPIGLWAVLLMLRPGRSDGMRFLLFLIGTAVTLTLVVELIYLPGDIGRMNTVFKFYLQAWIMFGLSSGICLIWTLKSLRYWQERLVFAWQALLYILIASAALFTVMGTTDKIQDRMASEAPHTLDGMTYMQYATYYDLGSEMNLEEDYQAIRWMQENIEGSPVILEGQAYEYRWGNRFTIYTGLPGVVGWNWHQRQQRAILMSNVVQERVDSVNTFYLTEDPQYVSDFLEEFDIQYVIFGQLEKIFYPGVGLEKFEAYEGQLWEAVYRVGETTIYRVLGD